MDININTKQREYKIVLERGALRRAGELITGVTGTGSRFFLISDSGVPEAWRDVLQGQMPGSPFYIFEQGEKNKCLDVYGSILSWLAANGASRRDVIVALGGGVVGDMAGFAAATYMRGIRYVNIPTTALSQVDSSIGGKTAIDLGGIKNIVGAFHQPSMVLVDPDTLDTLSDRQLNNGLAEAVKSGIIRDAGLFEIFESGDWKDRIDEILCRSLMVKRAIVEQDENEASLRKLLNFGHTLGHAYESALGGECLHGECVAMGMMSILDDGQLRERLRAVLERLSLPTDFKDMAKKIAAGGSLSYEEICSSAPRYLRNDKKAAGGMVDAVFVDEIGKAYIKSIDINELERRL